MTAAPWPAPLGHVVMARTLRLRSGHGAIALESVGGDRRLGRDAGCPVVGAAGRPAIRPADHRRAGGRYRLVVADGLRVRRATLRVGARQGRVPDGPPNGTDATWQLAPRSANDRPVAGTAKNLFCVARKRGSTAGKCRR